MVIENLAAHLRIHDSVDDILKHPAFAGFARLLLPWDDRRYDTTMPLRSVGSRASGVRTIAVIGGQT